MSEETWRRMGLVSQKVNITSFAALEEAEAFRAAEKVLITLFAALEEV
jgi:hypothetical protein